jgi:signal transduction histidine kinase
MTIESEFSRADGPGTLLTYAEQAEAPATDSRASDPSLNRSMAALVEGFSEQVAIVDERWTIIAVNEAWKRMIRLTGYPELTVGTNYRAFLASFSSKGHANASVVLRGLDAIDAGETSSFEHIYAGTEEWAGRTLQLRINRLHLHRRSLATVARQDITDAIELRRLREEVSSSVLDGQAEERRRFARELHDSAGQLLTGIGLLLTNLEAKSPASDTAGTVRELRDLVVEAQQEIRAISYLAHPPALETMGLAQATRSLVQGFGRRAGLQASFEQHGIAERLSHAAEIAFYRIVQEALANVHRHSNASRVRVTLIFRPRATHLVIADDGVGVAREKVDGMDGVGLSGMRSRLKEIDGRLSVRRLDPGTVVVGSLPLGPRGAIATPPQ